MNESVGAGSLNGFCRKGQTGYVYNAEGRRVYAADGEGSHEYLYDGRSLLAEYLGGSLERSYIYGEKLLGLATASGDYSLHLDPLGSVMEITGGAQGRSDCSRAYDPWGSFDETGTCEGDSALAYTGHQYDANSGWYYFGARYYDPAVARFLRMDPYFGDTNVPPSLHKYMYAYGNPYRYIDLEGYLGIFFDGTWNDKDDLDTIEAGALTNVAKLSKIYKSGPKGYYKGVGSDFGTKLVGGATGAGMRNRVEEAYKFIVKIYNDPKVPEEEKQIDIFGFSRGAAEARALANLIRKRGIPNYGNTLEKSNLGAVNGGETEYGKFDNVKVRFLGLYDTVDTVDPNGDEVDPGFVQQTRHVVAANEVRGSFALQSVYDNQNKNSRNMVECYFPGSHSDVGGGYPQEFQKSIRLSHIPLRWMRDEAVKNGVKFGVITGEDSVVPDLSNMSYEEMEKRYIHDSRWLSDRGRNQRTVYYPGTGTKTDIPVNDSIRQSWIDQMMLVKPWLWE